MWRQFEVCGDCEVIGECVGSVWNVWGVWSVWGMLCVRSVECVGSVDCVLMLRDRHNSPSYVGASLQGTLTTHSPITSQSPHTSESKEILQGSQIRWGQVAIKVSALLQNHGCEWFVGWKLILSYAYFFFEN